MSTAPTVVLSEIQRPTLRAVVDTFAPEVDAADDPTGFWRRKASDLGIHDAILDQLGSGAVPEERVQGLRQLLDALDEEGFAGAARGARADRPRVHGQRPRGARRPQRGAGTNPMLTTMALAHRTADAMLA